MEVHFKPELEKKLHDLATQRGQRTDDLVQDLVAASVDDLAEEEKHAAKLAALRAAIDEGDASGIAEGDVFARVRETLHLPSPSR